MILARFEIVDRDVEARRERVLYKPKDIFIGDELIADDQVDMKEQIISILKEMFDADNFNENLRRITTNER